MTDYTELARRLREALENEYFSGDSTMVAKEDVHRAAEILEAMGQQERGTVRSQSWARYPRGYQLAPIEPTPEMRAAVARRYGAAHEPDGCVDDYRAMLDAAPQPAQPQEQREPTGATYGIIDPDYGRVYTIARNLAWEEGYAIGLHGSFTRDLDMIAVPWTDAACDPEHLIRRVAEAAGLRVRDGVGSKPHGRRAWTLKFPAFGDPRFIDLSVMPRVQQRELTDEPTEAQIDEYEIHCNGQWVAGASGPGARAEIAHYLTQYEQDGPCEVYAVTRRLVDRAAFAAKE